MFETIWVQLGRMMCSLLEGDRVALRENDLGDLEQGRILSASIELVESPALSPPPDPVVEVHPADVAVVLTVINLWIGP